MPERIQRSRAKGWRMPPNTVCVSRPSKWGNVFTGVGAAARYRDTMTPLACEAAKAELRGRNLACWCRLDQPCHADVLLEIANG